MTSASAPADTELLEAQVRQWLAGRGHVRDLRVVVLEGGVILEGRAATYYAKQLAQHVVTKVLGMSLLANRIEVE